MSFFKVFQILLFMHREVRYYLVVSSTLGVQIIVRRMIINFRNFSQPYFLIWDRTITNLEMNEI